MSSKPCNNIETDNRSSSVFVVQSRRSQVTCYVTRSQFKIPFADKLSYVNASHQYSRTRPHFASSGSSNRTRPQVFRARGLADGWTTGSGRLRVQAVETITEKLKYRMAMSERPMGAVSRLTFSHFIMGNMRMSLPRLIRSRDGTERVIANTRLRAYYSQLRFRPITISCWLDLSGNSTDPLADMTVIKDVVQGTVIAPACKQRCRRSALHEQKRFRTSRKISGRDLHLSCALSRAYCLSLLIHVLRAETALSKSSHGG